MYKQELQARVDRVVVHLASTHANGFKAASVAPNTYKELAAAFAKDGFITVWNGASEHTIYLKPSVNHAARAWHDSAHLRIGADFTPQGERLTYEQQCRDVDALQGYGLGFKEYLKKLLDIEINAQVQYENEHGAFPVNQKEFTIEQMNKRR